MNPHAARPFHALIVEGTHGIGKSSLIDRLLRLHVRYSPERKIRTLVHLTQSHTYGPLARAEDDGTLTVEQNLRHLDRIVDALEWLHAGVASKDRASCFVLIDTLHVTHCVRPGVVSWQEVESVDARLASLGCKLLLLEGSDSIIRQRSIEASTGSQFLEVYARKFGSTADELHRYFINEQAELQQLVRRSAMKTLVFANDRDPDAAARGLYDFWAS